MFIEIFSWVLVGGALYGMYLNSNKKVIQSYKIWLAANIGFIILNIYHGVWAQAFLFSAYTCLILWGLYKWRSGKNGE